MIAGEASVTLRILEAMDAEEMLTPAKADSKNVFRSTDSPDVSPPDWDRMVPPLDVELAPV
jgi:hypothetical protein